MRLFRRKTDRDKFIDSMVLQNNLAQELLELLAQPKTTIYVDRNIVVKVDTKKKQVRIMVREESNG